MTDDEFTIARPRWIVPLAMLGALLLFLGVAVGALVSSGNDAPPARLTGTTVVTSGTAAASTTTVP